MLKLPSPSVVCAQNSPVILTIGFTRRRSTSTSLIHVAALGQRAGEVVARQLIDELAQVLGRVLEPAEEPSQLVFNLIRLLGLRKTSCM